MTAKYPHVKVKLTGGPSDPRAILSNVAEACAAAACPPPREKPFCKRHGNANRQNRCFTSLCRRSIGLNSLASRLLAAPSLRGLTRKRPSQTGSGNCWNHPWKDA